MSICLAHRTQPQNADSSALAGLVYAIDTSIGPDPISGCLVIISPTSRAVTQSVCYSRASIVAVQHFASAPIVAIDARGPGLHTILIAEFDYSISAFDPANLAAGPLFRVNPMPAGKTGTIACDYMTMTPGGSLVMTGWYEEVPGLGLTRYNAIAIPNILLTSPMPDLPAHSKTPEGLSPGAAAGIAVAVIVVVFASVIGGLYYTGRLPGVLSAIGLGRLLGGGAQYSSVKTFTSKKAGGLLPITSGSSAPYGGYSS